MTTLARTWQPPPVRHRQAAPRLWPEVLAALVTAAVYSLGQVLAGRYPFGPVTRNVNDLGAQLVPMHALYRDVLTGEAPGDLWLNWNSGLGVPFLPDLATYLGSPLTLLVVAFPRDRIDLALFVIQVLTMALAAAVMTTYLRRLAPGPWLLAAALGAAYGTNGWAVDDAGYLLPWLSGLVALPLLLVVGEWAVSGRRPLLGPMLVAVVWWANFYTAYMATIGAGLLVLVRLAALSPGWRGWLPALARLVSTAVLGVLLAAPLLVPTYLSNTLAQPSVGEAGLPAGWSQVLSRLLPATQGVGVSPGFFVTTAVLLLAATLPWHRRVPGRVRLAYCGGFVLLVASVFWYPTHVLWHGFDPPQGSPYRQAFVVCGWLVVLAWVAAARARPGLPAVAGGLVVVLAVLWGGAGSEHTSTWTVPVTVASLVVLLIALVVPVAVQSDARRADERRSTALLAAVVLGVVVVEGVLTAAVVAQEHRQLAKRPVWNPVFDEVRESALEVDAWPATRTTVGAGDVLGSIFWTGANDPMLLGGQGTGYYSSHMPQVTTDALRAVGVWWTNFGRSVVDLPDPVRDAVLGIGNRVDRSDPQDVHVDTVPSAPLVAARELPDSGDNAFLNRNALAGAEVYTLPEVRVLPADGGATVVTTCPAGTGVQLWAPRTTGAARLGDGPERELLPPGARRPGIVMGSGPVDLGPAPGGEVAVEVRSPATVRLPEQPVGCYREDALVEGVARLRQVGAEVSAGGHSFTATWPAPVPGAALALVPAVPGWTCSTGEGWAPPGQAAGFIAVHLDGASEVTCRFRPPGLHLGLGLAAAALAALAVLAALSSRRRHGEVS